MIPDTSATKQFNNSHAGNMPDFQKDVEFVMVHLNDPNFDLTQLPSCALEDKSTNRYVGDDDIGAMNVDESVALYPSLLTYISKHAL
jgi:hypothetical protein